MDATILNVCFMCHRWEFKTDGYDIGFAVFYEGVDGRVPVLKMEKVNSHLLPEDGAYTCSKL